MTILSGLAAGLLVYRLIERPLMRLFDPRQRPDGEKSSLAVAARNPAATCDAGNRVIDEPARIASIGSRPWATIGRDQRRLV